MGAQYLVEIRVPRPGDRYWCEGVVRTARGDGLCCDEEDEQPIILAENVVMLDAAKLRRMR